MKRFFALILAISMFFCVSAHAEVETIEVTTGGVNTYINGVLSTFTDAYGEAVEPFIYNGKVYLPLNCIADALDMSYTWDGSSMSAFLGAQTGETQLLQDVCPAYQKSYVWFYSTSEGTSFAMGGNSYTNGIRLDRIGVSYAMYNLNGEFESMSFTVGHVDGTNMKDGVLQIFLDGKLAEEISVSCEALPQEITIPLNRALSMKISYSNDPHHSSNNANDFTCGMANIAVR